MADLDPIVSLAVAIAEAPGSYAFFLGSGISRDAGVPTGGAVLTEARGELYRLENTTEEVPDQEGLAEWLRETGRSDLGYSEILEQIAPDAATRRDYLAKHFEQVEPTEAHRQLAALAEQGLVKVFVTTNFDRLLEHALQARGIEPIVVTDDASLASTIPRERASCFILKPHGDYFQQTIRNTPTELASLGPGISAELAEILDRYGIVVLGYSGSDQAVAKAMHARNSRYGFYWVSRGMPAAPASAIIEATSSRVIKRPGAVEFLRDLDRRLAVFRAHPSGDTPLSVHDEVMLLVRRGDQVGLGEIMRRERQELLGWVRAYVESHKNVNPTADRMIEAYSALRPAIDRRLGSLLPVIAYRPDGMGDEVAHLRQMIERKPTPSGYGFWDELTEWVVWCLGYALGGFALRLNQMSVLKSLFAARVGNSYGSPTEPLMDYTPREGGLHMATAVLAARSDSRWISPAWKLLTDDLATTDVLLDRWREFVTDGDPLRSLQDFDFLLSISLVLKGDPSLGHWLIYRDGATDYARRLHDDESARTDAAHAVGVKPDEFIERAIAALDSVKSPGHGDRESSAAAILAGQVSL
jgi:SIR2-like domain